MDNRYGIVDTTNVQSTKYKLPALIRSIRIHFIILLILVFLNCAPTVHGSCEPGESGPCSGEAGCGGRRLTAAEESEFLLTRDEANNFLHIKSRILLTPKELIGKKMDIVRRRLCGHEGAERSNERNCPADHRYGTRLLRGHESENGGGHTHTPSSCIACGGGYYNSAGSHSSCKTCGGPCTSTTYTSRHCGSGSNRVCTSCSMPTCGRGQKVSGCTTTADRTCSGCDSGFYQDSNSHSDTSCKACTATCASGTKFAACSKTADRTCPGCVSGQYQNTNGHAFTSCKSCITSCGIGKRFVACSTTADRTCPGCVSGQYQNTNGHAFTSCKSCITSCGIGKRFVACSTTADRTCPGCVSGQYQNTNGHAFTSCKSCITSCGIGKRFVACSKTADRTCPGCVSGQYQNTNGHASTSCKGCATTCASGTKFAACSATVDRTCSGCGSGQYQDSNSHAFTSCKGCATTCGSGTKFVACSTTAQRSCPGCGLGRYQSSSSHYETSCPVCKKGQYSDKTGSLTCIQCPIGTYLKDEGVTFHDEANDCIICPIFKYNPVPGRDECFPCPSSKEVGATTCSGCDPGKWNNKDSNSCIACPKGWYTGDRDLQACLECPAGYHAKDLTDSNVQLQRYDYCQSCIRGKYGDVKKAVDMGSGCKKCASGRYSDDEGVAKKLQTVVCKACIPGTYSKEKGNAKDSKCLNCVSGTWSSLAGVSSLTDCQLCGVGRFSADVGVANEDSCKSCPLGFEQIETGKAFCLPCAPGKFGKVNEDGIHSCSSCLANTYSDEVAQEISCKICAEGRKSSKQAVSCSLCPAGQQKDGNNCIQCTEGRYQPDTEKEDCLQCPHGRTSQNGAAVCSSCGIGRMKVGTDMNTFICKDCEIGKIADAGMQADIGCKDCAVGLYQSKKGKGLCHQCDAGTWSDLEGSSSVLNCYRCEQGFYSTATGAASSATCNACPPGKKGTLIGANSSKVCVQCKENQASSAGAAKCTGCPHGRTSTEGSAVCSKCTTGRRQVGNDIKSYTCNDCLSGKISKAGASECTDCVAGLYQPNTGEGACQPCDAGTWSDVVGSSSVVDCSKCEQGFYSTAIGAASSTTCNACPPGSKGTERGAVSNKACVKCDKDQASSAGAAKCTGCPHGRTSPEGSAVCSKCTSGRRQVGENINKYTCNDCLSGKISKAGTFECTDCVAGLYQPNTGEGACQPCDAGTWSTVIGSALSSTCKSCKQGFYSTARGAASSATCNACPPGKKSTVPGAMNSSVCTSCEIGEISASGATACTDCTIGTFTKEPGSASCTECGVGRYGFSKTKCTSCPKGWKRGDTDTDLTRCVQCNLGTFTKNKGSASCTDCSVGRFGSKTSCEFCPKGWKRGDEDRDLTKCIQCKLGETTQYNGSTTCSQCGIGEYGHTNGSCTTCTGNNHQKDKGQIECLACLNGEKANDKHTDCIKPTYLIPSDCDYINQYLNDSSLTKKDWKCQSCPLGGYCTGAINWSKVRPKYGWWRLHNIDTENINSPPNCLQTEENSKRSQPTCVFQKCLYPHACQGAPNPNRYTIDGTLIDPAHINSNFTETCDATQGYSNNCTDENNQPSRCRLCATCIGTGTMRYKRTGGSTRCKLCPAPTTNKILLAVGFLVMFLGLSFLVYSTIKGEEHGTGKRGGKLSAIKKIALNFMQMISIVASLPLEWPESINIMFNTMSTISSAGTTLLIPDCELAHLRTSDAFYMKQIFYTFSIPTLIVGSILTWSIIYVLCAGRLKFKWINIKHRMILTMTLLSFLCYPMLVKLCLGMLKCPTVGHVKYLMADLQEQCFVGRHSAYIVLLTIPQLIIYIVGLPLIAALLILRNQNRLNDPDFRLRYGLLYRGYAKGREWWEITVALRKVAAVSIGTFGSLIGIPEVQVGLALFVGLTSIVMHLVGQPFGDPNGKLKQLHFMEFFSLVVIWFTNWGGLMLYILPGTSRSKFLLTIAIILMVCSYNVIAIYVFGKALISAAIKKRKERLSMSNGETVLGDLNNTELDSDEEQNPTQVVPIQSNTIDDDIDNEQHIDNVIDEHRGHEERLNALHRERSKRAKRNTQLRLLERSKIKSLRILAQVPGFSQLNEIKISKMVDNMKLIKYQPGDVICQEGDAADCFYVILEGNCAINSLRHGKRRMATIGEYDFFGESMMTTNVAFRTRVATVTVVPEDEENEDMKKKSRHGAQVLVLERNQYDVLCSGGGIDLSETINDSIEVIAKQRKSENRENLLAGRAMNRLRSMRKEMGGEVKTKDEVKKLKQNDFTFKDL
jgi:hypothetical protein